jgi:hypothetical protein
MRCRCSALLVVSLVAVVAGCGGKYHPPEIDTSWIETLAVVVGQDAGHPVSLTLVESEVNRHLYQRFQLVTRGQLMRMLGEEWLRPGRLQDPRTTAEIGRRTRVDAVLEVVVTGHDIAWTSNGRSRATAAIAMQLVEVPSGAVRWIRSARRSDTAPTISEAVHEAVSDAVWDCLKHLIGYESIVQGGGDAPASAGGVTVVSVPEPAGGGLAVTAVTAGSTWDRAGLRVGDVVVSVNGRSLAGPRVEWPRAGEGRELSLSVRRGEELVELRVPVSR